MDKELEFLEEKYGDNSWTNYPPSKQQVAKWLKEYTEKQLMLGGVVFNEADIVNDNNTLNKHKKSWKAPEFDLYNSEVELCDHPKNYSRKIEGTLVCEKCGGTYL
jgi:hypothetical protein